MPERLLQPQPKTPEGHESVRDMITRYRNYETALKFIASHRCDGLWKYGERKQCADQLCLECFHEVATFALEGKDKHGTLLKGE